MQPFQKQADCFLLCSSMSIAVCCFSAPASLALSLLPFCFPLSNTIPTSIILYDVCSVRLVLRISSPIYRSTCNNGRFFKLAASCSLELSLPRGVPSTHGNGQYLFPCIGAPFPVAEVTRQSSHLAEYTRAPPSHWLLSQMALQTLPLRNMKDPCLLLPSAQSSLSSLRSPLDLAFISPCLSLPIINPTTSLLLRQDGDGCSPVCQPKF